MFSFSYLLPLFFPSACLCLFKCTAREKANQSIIILFNSWQAPLLHKCFTRHVVPTAVKFFHYFYNRCKRFEALLPRQEMLASVVCRGLAVWAAGCTYVCMYVRTLSDVHMCFVGEGGIFFIVKNWCLDVALSWAYQVYTQVQKFYCLCGSVLTNRDGWRYFWARWKSKFGVPTYPKSWTDNAIKRCKNSYLNRVRQWIFKTTIFIRISSTATKIAVA